MLGYIIDKMNWLSTRSVATGLISESSLCQYVDFVKQLQCASYVYIYIYNCIDKNYSFSVFSSPAILSHWQEPNGMFSGNVVKYLQCGAQSIKCDGLNCGTRGWLYQLLLGSGWGTDSHSWLSFHSRTKNPEGSQLWLKTHCSSFWPILHSGSFSILLLSPAVLKETSDHQ